MKGNKPYTCTVHILVPYYLAICPKKIFLTILFMVYKFTEVFSPIVSYHMVTYLVTHYITIGKHKALYHSQISG